MSYVNECLRDQFNMRQRGFSAFLKELNIAPMHFSLDKKNHEFGNQTIEMHCFASENQIYTGTVTFGVEPFKSLKGQENLLSFSGCTHAHAKCRPVDIKVLILSILWIFMSDIKLSRNLILAKLSEIR